MRDVWSDYYRILNWRKLWVALAESQMELGLDISEDQVSQLKENINNIDFDEIEKYESKFHHDVFANIHAFGDVAPKAKPIIHLGATSQFVVDNTDIIRIKDSYDLIIPKIAEILDQTCCLASVYKDSPVLGMTHMQPAQPTTLGKRMAVWGYDLILAIDLVEYQANNLKLRGVKGATGTQASFIDLFGDYYAVNELDKLVCRKLGWGDPHPITGQTYPRSVDTTVVSPLATLASVCMKIAIDIRMMCSRGEMGEPFSDSQVGSSAMAYKRNPIKSEKICGLGKILIGHCQPIFTMASEQILERTLDDSSCKRVVIPECFLIIDEILESLLCIMNGLRVHCTVALKNLKKEMPFIATERILMKAVEYGADRQDAHEIIRRHSVAVAENVEMGYDNDLIDRLRNEEIFKDVDFDIMLNPHGYIGAASEQVEEFIESTANAVRARYV